MQTPHCPLTTLLLPYKNLVEQIIEANLDHFGPPTSLRKACEYALRNGGKRFRPALVLMITKALGYQVDVSQAALAIEYFHTASLIADDLPCMDNDDLRRDKPSTHKVYGETIALLATYALISAGYHCLVKAAEALKGSSHPLAHQTERLCVLALENGAYNTGILGATGGQYLDSAPPNLDLNTLREVIHKKTVTLFEISFVYGWIFGGGNLQQLPLVKKAASHFGMAFQIVDDMDDMLQDVTHNHPLNMANLFGVEQATKMFYEEISQFEESLHELKLHSADMQGLVSYLISLVD